jgi:hypothetical protein
MSNVRNMVILEGFPTIRQMTEDELLRIALIRRPFIFILHPI